MSYAAIMTQAGVSADDEARVRLAAQLANRFGAALLGVGVEAPAQVATVPAGAEGAKEASAEGASRLAHRCFESIASHVAAGMEWRASRAPAASALIRELRGADLIVMNPAQAPEDPDPGDVLMQSGRPVLIAPRGQATLEPCRVAIAWKDGRECRRALTDAMPFLQQAVRVRVVEVCDEPGRDEAEARLKDLVSILARRGVQADFKVLSGGDADAPSALRQFCTGWEVDLLIAGGYGHARVSEWMFGGVTRELLRDWPAPVLLSH